MENWKKDKEVISFYILMNKLIRDGKVNDIASYNLGVISYIKENINLLDNYNVQKSDRDIILKKAKSILYKYKKYDEKHVDTDKISNYLYVIFDVVTNNLSIPRRKYYESDKEFLVDVAKLCHDNLKNMNYSFNNFNILKEIWLILKDNNAVSQEEYEENREIIEKEENSLKEKYLEVLALHETFKKVVRFIDKPIPDAPTESNIADYIKKLATYFENLSIEDAELIDEDDEKTIDFCMNVINLYLKNHLIDNAYAKKSLRELKAKKQDIINKNKYYDFKNKITPFMNNYNITIPKIDENKNNAIYEHLKEIEISINKVAHQRKEVQDDERLIHIYNYLDELYDIYKPHTRENNLIERRNEYLKQIENLSLKVKDIPKVGLFLYKNAENLIDSKENKKLAHKLRVVDEAIKQYEQRNDTFILTNQTLTELRDIHDAKIRKAINNLIVKKENIKEEKEENKEETTFDSIEFIRYIDKLNNNTLTIEELSKFSEIMVLEAKIINNKKIKRALAKMHNILININEKIANIELDNILNVEDIVNNKDNDTLIEIASDLDLMKNIWKSATNKKKLDFSSLKSRLENKKGKLKLFSKFKTYFREEKDEIAIYKFYKTCKKYSSLKKDVLNKKINNWCKDNRKRLNKVLKIQDSEYVNKDYAVSVGEEIDLNLNEIIDLDNTQNERKDLIINKTIGVAKNYVDDLEKEMYDEDLQKAKNTYHYHNIQMGMFGLIGALALTSGIALFKNHGEVINKDNENNYTNELPNSNLVNNEENNNNINENNNNINNDLNVKDILNESISTMKDARNLINSLPVTDGNLAKLEMQLISLTNAINTNDYSKMTNAVNILKNNILSIKENMNNKDVNSNTSVAEIDFGTKVDFVNDNVSLYRNMYDLFNDDNSVNSKFGTNSDLGREVDAIVYTDSDHTNVFLAHNKEEAETFIKYGYDQVVGYRIVNKNSFKNDGVTYEGWIKAQDTKTLSLRK